MCPNKYGCQPQIAGRIEHFVARHAMNIDGIGEEVADKLYSSGLVTNVADLYDLTQERLMTLDKFKEKASQRILTSLEESKKVPFARVIFALSIPFVGETVAKVLAPAVKNIDNLMTMTADELSQIDEIGPKIAESIVSFFALDDNRLIVQRLRNAGLQMANEEVEAVSNKLEGKKIVISGVFEHHSRDEYKRIIEQHGGKNVSSISANTDFVFAGENMGPAKLEKARKLQIPIISEQQFLDLINS